MAKEVKRLYRSEKDKMIGGVCAGIAEYFQIDPVLVRVIAVILLIVYGASLIGYLLLWIIVPIKSELKKKKK